MSRLKHRFHWFKGWGPGNHIPLSNQQISTECHVDSSGNENEKCVWCTNSGIYDGYIKILSYRKSEIDEQINFPDQLDLSIHW